MLRITRRLLKMGDCPIALNLTSIKNEINSESEKFGRNVKLIAVSKTKTEEDIIKAYEAGHRDFGENYPNELKTKAASETIKENCPDIKWHFIGSIQKKSLNNVLKSHGLNGIETVTSLDLVKLIEKRRTEPLQIMLQINTSKEEQKGGYINDEDVIETVNYIIGSCKYVHFEGLMTIGSAENSKMAAETGEPNPDFSSLVKLKETVSKNCDVPISNIQLSMGMSTGLGLFSIVQKFKLQLKLLDSKSDSDYLQAIKQGANVIRVGSKIFGAREYKK